MKSRGLEKRSTGQFSVATSGKEGTNLVPTPPLKLSAADVHIREVLLRKKKSDQAIA
jgi:hypothetical protein